MKKQLAIVAIGSLLGSIALAGGKANDLVGRTKALAGREIKKITQEMKAPYPKPLAEIYKGVSANQMGMIEAIRSNPNWVKVVCADSGVDYNHPNLAYAVSRDWIYKNNRPRSYFDHNLWAHGTGVASRIAFPNPNVRIELIPVVLGYVGDKRFVAELQLAYEHGARIFNFSFGSLYLKDKLLFEFIKSRPDAIFVCAAGNDGSDIDRIPHYPSSLPFDNVIAVAASEGAEPVLCNFSNYGPKTTHFAAEGDNVVIAGKNGKVILEGGTSFSAPIVTHAIAKMKSIDPTLMPLEIKDILKASVKPLYYKCKNGLEPYPLVDDLSKIVEKTSPLLWKGVLDEDRALEFTKERLTKKHRS